ncbi:hypothetical protein RHGRI_012138 [Rhododendron griersonianum]|uniref:Uncharacterized protein n=1 Tax=Rhododendron griersonianum TaxID=479676 RepID=A0AAV6KPY2_9ERIC|nr:hypothetical protein RHGRI_012138 [Rhododendron griersonianum]
MVTSKNKKKKSKRVDFETVKEQLEEVEEMILQLAEVKSHRTRKIEVGPLQMDGKRSPRWRKGSLCEGSDIQVMLMAMLAKRHAIGLYIFMSNEFITFSNALRNVALPIRSFRLPFLLLLKVWLRALCSHIPDTILLVELISSKSSGTGNLLSQKFIIVGYFQ